MRRLRKGYLRLAFGAGTHERSIAQTIDVSAIATDIDKKTIIAAVSAYLGGFQDADTTGQVIAAFRDVSGTELGKIETPVYDTKQPPNQIKAAQD